MKVKNVLMICLALLLSCSTTRAAANKGAVLFDGGHGVDAGNADWRIDGAYSEFADTLTGHGFTVESTVDALTLEHLQKYQALVLPEPNSRFTPAEEQAIIQFIANGGGVFFIGDHIESDRNRDGIDSVGVFNHFVTPLGFKLEDANILEANLSAEPVSGEYKEHPVTYNIKSMAVWAGTSIRILDPKLAQGVIFFNEWLYGQPALAVGTYGQGRYVVLGDSAIFDDGTGTRPTETRHKGFFDYDHKQLSLNVVNWLVGQPAEDL